MLAQAVVPYVRRRLRRLAPALAAALLLAHAPAIGRAAGAPGPAPLAPRTHAPMLVLPPGGFQLPDSTIKFGPLERDRCLRCHGLHQFLVRDTVGGPVRDLTVGRAAFAGSAHQALACTQCHGDVQKYPHEFRGVRPRVGCDADCHALDRRGHAVRHDKVTALYARSVHARGLADSTADSPGCVYCHGDGDAHAVPRERHDLSADQRLARCAPCHADRERMARRKVDPTATDSYRGTLHYAELRLGDAHAPACDDCHDAHGVRASRDTASTVAATHLTRTCSQRDCHAGAGERFARSQTSHPHSTAAAAPVLAAEAWLLGGMGGLVVALLALGVLLDAQRRLLRRRSAAPAPRVVGEQVLRLSVGTRVLHLALAASFTMLAITGLPLRFPDSAPLAAIVRSLGGLAATRWLHRASAVVMGLVYLVHLAQAAVSLVRARFDAAAAWPMLPTTKDLSDAGQWHLHALRLRPLLPASDRHHFREKIHYWAVMWGVPLMGITGAILWFAVPFAEHLPRAALAASAMAHADEALLAVAIVIVWHLYQVHVAPGANHRFMTWLDGKITREEWLTQHPLEAERLTGERLDAERRTRLVEESLGKRGAAPKEPE